MLPDCGSVQTGVVTIPDSVPARVSTHHFLAEVRLLIPRGRDPSWIGRGLHAACRRLSGISARPRIVSVVYSPADDRLVCILEAASWKDVRDLFEIALLPPVRVLEVVMVEDDGPQFQQD
jgi:hypothetical protein